MVGVHAPRGAWVLPVKPGAHRYAPTASPGRIVRVSGALHKPYYQIHTRLHRGGGLGSRLAGVMLAGYVSVTMPGLNT